MELRARHLRPPLGRDAAADRADVPRQRLGHAVCGGDGRRQAGAARPAPRRSERLRADARRARHLLAGRAHRVADAVRSTSTRTPRSTRATLGARSASASAARPCRARCSSASSATSAPRSMQGWGMTETSPIGVINTLLPKHAELTAGRAASQVKLKQGRGVWGVELKIVDDDGEPLPWDGKAFGHLLVRGPWIASGYFKGEGGSHARRRRLLRHRRRRHDRPRRLPAAGRPRQGRDQVRRRMDLVDRPRERRHGPSRRRRGRDHRRAASQVAGAAAAARRQAARAAIVDAAGVLEFLRRPQSPSGGCPTTCCSFTELPHTATGKLLKKALRDQYRDHRAADGLASPARLHALALHDGVDGGRREAVDDVRGRRPSAARCAPVACAPRSPSSRRPRRRTGPAARRRRASARSSASSPAGRTASSSARRRSPTRSRRRGSPRSARPSTRCRPRTAATTRSARPTSRR